jgi:hypothetical protein
MIPERVGRSLVNGHGTAAAGAVYLLTGVQLQGFKTKTHTGMLNKDYLLNERGNEKIQISKFYSGF